MNSFFSHDTRPNWAYNWCYFFAVMGVLTLLTGLGTLALYKKMATPLIVASLIAAGIQATHRTLLKAPSIRCHSHTQKIGHHSRQSF